MELSTLRTRFNQKVFADPNETTVSNSVIDSYINEAQDDFFVMAMNHQGGWQINQGYSYAPLEEGRNEYPLPLDLITVNQIYVKPSEDEDYIKCEIIDPADVGQRLYDHAPAEPVVNLKSQGFVLHMNEIKAVSQGLRIHYQSLLEELKNDTDKPKMPRMFHPYLYLKAAREYCEDAELYNKAKSIGNKLLKMEEDIKYYYSSRNRVTADSVSPAPDNFI